jgi:hypothetical protein
MENACVNLKAKENINGRSNGSSRTEFVGLWWSLLGLVPFTNHYFDDFFGSSLFEPLLYRRGT